MGRSEPPGYTDLVRRLWIIVLIALLPLQSIWAAAANACQDQCSAAAEHFGHHEHEHPVTLIAEDGSAGASTEHGATGVADVSTYHGHGSVAVILEDWPQLTASPSGVSSCPYEWHLADRFLESPLRPPQHPLA